MNLDWIARWITVLNIVLTAINVTMYTHGRRRRAYRAALEREIEEYEREVRRINLENGRVLLEVQKQQLENARRGDTKPVGFVASTREVK